MTMTSFFYLYTYVFAHARGTWRSLLTGLATIQSDKKLGCYPWMVQIASLIPQLSGIIEEEFYQDLIIPHHPVTSVRPYKMSTFPLSQLGPD